MPARLPYNPAQIDDDTAVLTGRLIGAFELLEWIGSGGMGEVYRARDTKLHRDVAVGRYRGPAGGGRDRGRERHQLVWVDRKGAISPIADERAAFRQPRLSPDGKLIAVAANDDMRRSNVWIYDR